MRAPTATPFLGRMARSRWAIQTFGPLVTGRIFCIWAWQRPMSSTWRILGPRMWTRRYFSRARPAVGRAHRKPTPHGYWWKLDPRRRTSGYAVLAERVYVQPATPTSARTIG